MQPDFLAGILSEVTFTTSRSGGPGGQNVNKVNSKVTLKWDVRHSVAIREDQRQHILQSLKRKLSKEGVLAITEQGSRSQLTNKELAITRLENLLAKAFVKRKKRKPTKPTKASVQKRIQEKKQRSEKKKWRQQPD
ncbi:MAG: alternative ribosome rescue aminoacyl-tRNA hydrolase ArfB [Cyclobacteriaceae bacterium]